MPQILVSMEDTSENILATLPNCGNPLKLEMETKKCKGCREHKTLDMYDTRPNGKLTLHCKFCLELARQRYAQNKERILEYHKNNKEKRNARLRERGQNDPSYRAKESMKVRIFDLLKNKKVHKTNRLFGCSKHELQEWLEYQFGDEYSWDTYGKNWHIDHVVPIKFFNLQNADEQLICFNWTNLRPLQASQNGSKSCKVLEDDILEHIQNLKQFPRYQTDYENSWWRRLELRYGNNPQDDSDFVNHLKWAIRNQDST